MTATHPCCSARRGICAETRNFAGSVALIFQPAEEGGAGGRAMVRDGMMDRFNISKVFGMHNMPGLDVGKFAIRPGAIMAATDEFTITVNGKGGHAAMPHRTIDPVFIASQLVSAFQGIVSRNADPLGIAGHFRHQIPRRGRPERHPASRRARRARCAHCKRTCGTLPKRA